MHPLAAEARVDAGKRGCVRTKAVTTANAAE
jgi:hypothetical protein